MLTGSRKAFLQASPSASYGRKAASCWALAEQRQMWCSAKLSSSKGHVCSLCPPHLCAAPLGDSFSFCHFPLTLFWLDTLFMDCDILYFWIDFLFGYCKAFLWTSTSGWYIFFFFTDILTYLFFPELPTLFLLFLLQSGIFNYPPQEIKPH